MGIGPHGTQRQGGTKSNANTRAGDKGAQGQMASVQWDIKIPTAQRGKAPQGKGGTR